MNLNQFTQKSVEAIQAAQQLAGERQNQQIRQERWTLKQCKEISETAAIMQKNIDHIEQQPQRTANTRQR